MNEARIALLMAGDREASVKACAQVRGLAIGSICVALVTLSQIVWADVVVVDLAQKCMGEFKPDNDTEGAHWGHHNSGCEGVSYKIGGLAHAHCHSINAQSCKLRRCGAT